MEGRVLELHNDLQVLILDLSRVLGNVLNVRAHSEILGRIDVEAAKRCRVVEVGVVIVNRALLNERKRNDREDVGHAGKILVLELAEEQRSGGHCKTLCERLGVHAARQVSCHRAVDVNELADCLEDRVHRLAGLGDQDDVLAIQIATLNALASGADSVREALDAGREHVACCRTASEGIHVDTDAVVDILFTDGALVDIDRLAHIDENVVGPLAVKNHLEQVLRERLTCKRCALTCGKKDRAKLGYSGVHHIHVEGQDHHVTPQLAEVVGCHNVDLLTVKGHIGHDRCVPSVCRPIEVRALNGRKLAEASVKASHGHIEHGVNEHIGSIRVRRVSRRSLDDRCLRRPAVGGRRVVDRNAKQLLCCVVSLEHETVDVGCRILKAIGSLHVLGALNVVRTVGHIAHLELKGTKVLLHCLYVGGDRLPQACLGIDRVGRGRRRPLGRRFLGLAAAGDQQRAEHYEKKKRAQ